MSSDQPNNEQNSRARRASEMEDTNREERAKRLPTSQETTTTVIDSDNESY